MPFPYDDPYGYLLNTTEEEQHPFYAPINNPPIALTYPPLTYSLHPYHQQNVHDTYHPGWMSVSSAPPSQPSSQWVNTPTLTTSTFSSPRPLSENGSLEDHFPQPTASHALVKRRRESSDEVQAKKKHRLEGQEQLAMNRLKGACLNCQMRTNKHRCPAGPDPDGPCQACIKKGTSLCPVICRRARFQDVEIFRLGPSRDYASTLRWLRKECIANPDQQFALWKPIENLPRKKSRGQPTPYKTLKLSQLCTSTTLDLRVQEYDPNSDDRQHYTWFENDFPRTYECPPYAIADRDHAKEVIRSFISENMEDYIDHLLPESEETASKFVRMVFQTALARSLESSLVALALRFWVAGRFIESPWSIRGEEDLGMCADTNINSPYYNRIPVTPIMDFQIDNIVIHEHLKKLLQDIRKAMRQKIMPIKKDDWFDVHLTTFILLHHVDLTVQHDMEFAKQHNIWHRRFSNKPLIDMITFGANTLLEYVHHEKGYFPLSASWDQVESAYNFTGPQKVYLLSARKLIKQLGAPQQPGDALFWTSQLHVKQWEPVPVTVS